MLGLGISKRSGSGCCGLGAETAWFLFLLFCLYYLEVEIRIVKTTVKWKNTDIEDLWLSAMI